MFYTSQGDTLLRCDPTAVGTPEGSARHPERRWEGDRRGLAASARGLHEGQTLTGYGHLGTGRRGEIHYAVTLSCN